MGTRGLFLSAAKQSGTMGLSLHKFLLFANPPFSVSVSLSLFVGPGGSELNVFGGDKGGTGGIQVL